MKKVLKAIGQGLHSALIGLISVALVTQALYATNYTMTQGSGTTFGSVVVSAVNYPQTLICDPTTPTQCMAINASGIPSVAQSGTWNITNVSGTVSLPTGAATSALQTTGNTSLTTINTTLGSPFQAGGALAANQSVNEAQINGVTPLMGNGVSGTGAQRVVIASDNTANSNPWLVNPGTAASWGIGTATQNSASATNGRLALGQFNTAPTTITTGNMSPLQMDNAGNLLVNIKAGAGSGGTAIADAGTFTAGTTSGTPVIAEFTSGGATACVTGHACWVGMTAARGLFTDASSWAGTTLGAPSNYGTSPGAVTVPGVNAFVTNTNANGSATSANSAPVVIASDQAAVAVKAASGAIASGAIAAGAQVDLLTMRGTVAAGTAAANSIAAGGVFTSTAPTLTTGQQVALQVSARGGLLPGSQYPAGATPITISATGTTAATTATLATGASVTTYICGYSIRANATAAATGNATVTGTITGTLNFTQWTAPNASGLGINEQVFMPCVPASAVNTGIAVISAAPGTGGVVSVTAWGFTL